MQKVLIDGLYEVEISEALLKLIESRDDLDFVSKNATGFNSIDFLKLKEFLTIKHSLEVLDLEMFNELTAIVNFVEESNSLDR